MGWVKATEVSNASRMIGDASSILFEKAVECDLNGGIIGHEDHSLICESMFARILDNVCFNEKNMRFGYMNAGPADTVAQVAFMKSSTASYAYFSMTTYKQTFV